MPSADKKWDTAAERDLCVAVIMGNQGADRIRHDWPKIFAFMQQLGYGFTKEAISQHFTKVIMKDFKSRHGNGPKQLNPAKSTPTKALNTPKKATPVSSKKRARKSVEVEVEVEDEDSDVNRKPKKVKRDLSETPVKSEDDDLERERSATVLDNETAFQKWLEGPF